MKDCIFCQINAGSIAAHKVLDDDAIVAFLDRAPLFRGHVLVVPRVHHGTLGDLPAELISPLFSAAQRIARAVERALGAEGTFVAMNNRISQSVPHLHVHVVPRKKGDGLRGFFWPRQKYTSEDEMAETARAIARSL